MKKYLFIIIITLLTLNAGYSQTNLYHPFPDSAGIWNEHYATQSFNTYYLYGIFGDTIINSIEYHKVYRHIENLTPQDTIMTVSNSYFIGGIREDSLKRIYFYNYNAVGCCGITDSTYLLYDFSKQVGDTIKFDYPQFGYNYQYLIVNSIDSVLVNNQYRKRFNLDGDTWIEGIGSTRDLLSNILGIPTCFCINEIVCYKFEDITYYLNPIFHDCFPYLGVNVEDISQPESIFISPNPMVSRAFIYTNKMFTDATLTIFNSIGQAVKQITNISGQSITLNRDNLPSGLYILQLTRDNKLYTTNKFVITDN